MKFINKMYALETQNKSPKTKNLTEQQQQQQNVLKIMKKKLKSKKYCNHKKSKLIKLNYISHIPQSINIPYRYFYFFLCCVFPQKRPDYFDIDG